MFEAVDRKRKESELVCYLLFGWAFHPHKYIFLLALFKRILLELPKNMFQATWKNLVLGHSTDGSDVIPPLPSRLVTDEDLKQFNEAMKIYDDVPKGEGESNGVKRKIGALGGLDTQHYGRGKRAREVVFLFCSDDCILVHFLLFTCYTVLSIIIIPICHMRFPRGNSLV